MIHITVHSTVSVTITQRPNWLARLFGAQESVRDANRVRILGGTYGWMYADNREVSREVGEAIDRALTVKAVRDRIERMAKR